MVQYVEVHGVCTRQDRRAESEGSQSEAAGHLGLHLPPAAVRGPAAQAPDPAQITHRVSDGTLAPQSRVGALAGDVLTALFVSTKEREAEMDHSDVSI